MNCELPDVQAGFRKAEELEIKMPIYVGSSKKIFMTQIATMV